MTSDPLYHAVTEAIARLFRDEEAFVDAIVADGWSPEMARAGIARHKVTWDVDAAYAAVEAERPAGPAKSSVVHIWPALPGAGISPWIYAALCGVEKQFVRGGGRSEHLSRYFADRVGELCDTRWLGRAEDWSTLADHVVVSGSDETVDAVRRATDATVTGYGHRMSIAIAQTNSDVTALADDIVLWRQQGCFSVSAVGYVDSNIDAFCAELGGAIGEAIARYKPAFTAGERAAQVAQFAVSQFVRPVFGTQFGWAERRPGPIDGEAIAPCAVSVHSLELDGWEKRITIDAQHRQGVGLDAAISKKAMLASGFTRICDLGELQRPPITWPHDGRSNIADYFFGAG